MILSKYLTRESSYYLLMVTFVLLLALLSQQIVRYLNYVAIGKIPTSLLFTLVGFEIPYLLALLLPLGLFMGILLAYGRLYQDYELPVMLMSGYSQIRLFTVTAFLGMIIAGVVLSLMLWVNPTISLKRQMLMTSDETTLHLIKTLVPGRFQVSPDGRHVMYVEKLTRDHTLAENVFLAQEKITPNRPDLHSWVLVLARQGYQLKDAPTGQPLFVMGNGYRYEGMPGENDYKIIQFEKYTLRLPQNDVRIAHHASETLPSTYLFDHYGNRKMAAELQWRLSIPLCVFLFSLLAVQLSAMRLRHSRYLILLPALFIYIAYIQLLYIARRWLEQGIVPISLGMWWVHAIVVIMLLVIASYQMRWFRKV